MHMSEKESEITLTPTQKRAFDGLLGGLAAGSVVVLRGDSGMGKTAILRKVHAAEGGAFFSVRQLMDALMSQPPAAIEEACLHVVDTGRTSHALVIVGDLHETAA